MKIRDKNLKKLVDVSSEECPRLQCYWPRLDPGSFTQGVGYRYRSDDWICGTREINGCPDKRETKTRGGAKDGVLAARDSISMAVEALNDEVSARGGYDCYWLWKAITALKGILRLTKRLLVDYKDAFEKRSNR